MAVLSRTGLADVATSFAGAPTWDADTAQDALFTHGAGIVEARAVGATCGPLRVWSPYVNGREPAHPHHA